MAFPITSTTTKKIHVSSPAASCVCHMTCCQPSSDTTWNTCKGFSRGGCEGEEGKANAGFDGTYIYCVARCCLGMPLAGALG